MFQEVCSELDEDKIRARFLDALLSQTHGAEFKNIILNLVSVTPAENQVSPSSMPIKTEPLSNPTNYDPDFKSETSEDSYDFKADM